MPARIKLCFHIVDKFGEKNSELKKMEGTRRLFRTRSSPFWAFLLLFVPSVFPSSHWIVTQEGKIQAQVRVKIGNKMKQAGFVIFLNTIRSRKTCFEKKTVYAKNTGKGRDWVFNNVISGFVLNTKCQSYRK